MESLLSGSAVLDTPGRTALALLVEQKPLRAAVASGQRQAASNVLYAVPIGDVIAACGMWCRPPDRLGWTSGSRHRETVGRPDLLDEAVGRGIEAEAAALNTGGSPDSWPISWTL